jgi:uncharacterized protein (DUF1501 family)
MLKLDDSLGFHPSMKLRAIGYEKGEVAVLRASGTEEPNRSHFRALDIGTARTPTARRGPVGSDATPTASMPQAGRGELIVHFGSPVTLAVRRGTDVAARARERGFVLDHARQKYPADQAERQAAFRKLCESEKPERKFRPEPRNGYAEMVRETTASGLAHADLDGVPQEDEERGEVPAEPRREAPLAARMIAGGMKTRVLRSLPGSTRTRSSATHAELLQNLSEATDAFFQDLARRPEKDVVLMVFSEFRPARRGEDASARTDHGAAAPVFVIGPSVKGGLHGSPPDLEHLVDGDVARDRFPVGLRDARDGVARRAGRAVGDRVVPFCRSSTRRRRSAEAGRDATSRFARFSTAPWIFASSNFPSGPTPRAPSAPQLARGSRGRGCSRGLREWHRRLRMHRTRPAKPKGVPDLPVETRERRLALLRARSQSIVFLRTPVIEVLYSGEAMRSARARA